MKRQELIFFRKEIINSMVTDLKRLYHDKTTYATEFFIKETKNFLIQLECDTKDISLWIDKNQYYFSADGYIKLHLITDVINDTIDIQRQDLNEYDEMIQEIVASKELTNRQKSENAIRLHEQEHGSINRFIIQVFGILQRLIMLLDKENYESGDVSQNTFYQIFPDSLFDVNFTRSNDLKHLQPEQDDSIKKNA